MEKTQIKQIGGYGVVPNTILNSPKLSLRAKGLYVFIESKPDGWEFSRERIAKQNKEGVTTIRSVLKELENAGLLERKEHQKTEDGKWKGYDYILKRPSAEIPPTETRPAVIPPAVNPPSKKERDSKKETAIKKEQTTLAPAKAGAEKEPKEKEKYDAKGAEVIKEFEVINPACKKMYGNKTQREACDNLISTYGYERVITVVRNTLSKTNTIPFFPSITTPQQLWLKWSQLETAVAKYKMKQQEIKSKPKCI